MPRLVTAHSCTLDFYLKNEQRDTAGGFSPSISIDHDQGISSHISNLLPCRDLGGANCRVRAVILHCGFNRAEVFAIRQQGAHLVVHLDFPGLFGQFDGSARRAQNSAKRNKQFITYLHFSAPLEIAEGVAAWAERCNLHITACCLRRATGVYPVYPVSTPFLRKLLVCTDKKVSQKNARNGTNGITLKIAHSGRAAHAKNRGRE